MSQQLFANKQELLQARSKERASEMSEQELEDELFRSNLEDQFDFEFDQKNS